MSDRDEEGILIGLVSVSDRASSGVYEDKGIPALREWCTAAIETPVRFAERLIPDDRYTIEKTLTELVDDEKCDLVLTTGGTGPSRRDVTPEATLAVATRELPGFGEQMRAISLKFVPTAILSRQVGALREIPDHAALIINLPGQPKAIAETLGGLRDEDGKVIVPSIFAAVPYCIDLIGGPWVDTRPEVCKAFRPKSALKAREEALKAAAEKAVPDVPEKTEAPQPPEKAPEAETRQTPPFVDPAPVRIPGNRNAVPEPPASDLETIVIEPSDTRLPPPCTVVWLGGMGVDIHDFSDLPSEIEQLGGPAARYVMVNAPEMQLSMDPANPLRAWYDLPGRNLIDYEDEEGIRMSARRISRLIDSITARGMPRQRIFLAGFSQGGSMALFTGLREELSIAGIISLSGYLPLAGRIADEIRPGGLATPVFMGNGDFDEIVPIPVAQQSLQAISHAGAAVSWRDYPTEHTLSGEALRDTALFMRRVLGGKH